MAATASAKCFGVKVLKYFAVVCINGAVTGVTVSNCNKFYAFSNFVGVRKDNSLLSWPSVENNTKK